MNFLERFLYIRMVRKYSRKLFQKFSDEAFKAMERSAFDGKFRDFAISCAEKGDTPSEASIGFAIHVLGSGIAGMTDDHRALIAHAFVTKNTAYEVANNISGVVDAAADLAVRPGYYESLRYAIVGALNGLEGALLKRYIDASLEAGKAINLYAEPDQDGPTEQT